jgi:hypothetical protein
MKNKKIAIVLCYGHFSTSKKPQEVEALTDYLSKVTNFISQDLSSYSGIVIAGGYSDNAYPEPESLTYSSFFEKLLVQNSNCSLFYQTTSLCHSEHIAFSLLSLRKYFSDLSNFELSIFCDSVFVTKTKVIAHGLLEGKFAYEVIDFERNDIHPKAIELIQNTEKLPKEIFSTNFESLVQLVKNI